MGNTSRLTSSNYLLIIAVLTLLLTPAVRLVREPPKNVLLTTSSHAGLYAPNLEGLADLPGSEVRRGVTVVADLGVENTYRMKVGDSVSLLAGDGSAIRVDRERLQIQLTLAGRGEADVTIAGETSLAVAGQPTTIDLPDQPSIVRNIMDSLALASLIAFGHWAYGRRHIRSQQSLADASGDEIRLRDSY